MLDFVDESRGQRVPPGWRLCPICLGGNAGLVAALIRRLVRASPLPTGLLSTADVARSPTKRISARISATVTELSASNPPSVRKLCGESSGFDDPKWGRDSTAAASGSPICRRRLHDGITASDEFVDTDELGRFRTGSTVAASESRFDGRNGYVANFRGGSLTEMNCERRFVECGRSGAARVGSTFRRASSWTRPVSRLAPRTGIGHRSECGRPSSAAVYGGLLPFQRRPAT